MLREITNTIESRDGEMMAGKGKRVVILDDVKQGIPLGRQGLLQDLVFGQCVSLSTRELSFGPCLPSTIHQRTLTLTLHRDLPKPVLFCMQIICHNQKLNEMSEFVFAIKKDRQVEFTDWYRFRLNKKGNYNFTIGVKTPGMLIGEQIQSELRVGWELGCVRYGQRGRQENWVKEDGENSLLSSQSSSCSHQPFYTIKLKQQIYAPQIQCPRQLTSSTPNQIHPIRVLKFSQIRSKLKKQVKIPFTLKTQGKITLVNELLGMQHECSELEKNAIEVVPRQLGLTGSGVFMVTFRFNFTQEMADYIEGVLQSGGRVKTGIPSYTLRRVMTMRINQTSIFFHFPIEVSFLLGSKKNPLESSE